MDAESNEIPESMDVGSVVARVYCPSSRGISPKIRTWGTPFCYSWELGHP
jgi:hypothetical protein